MGARAEQDREWVPEAEIDPELLRVRAGERTCWFVRDAPLPGEGARTLCEAEAAVWPDAVEGLVEGRPGLLVPRCEGGLLVDALRQRGGMEPSLALGVLDEVLAALEVAPSAPPHASRTAMRAFAVRAGGEIALVPGRLRDAAARTDSAELGELLHLALTGRTWEETGLPLALTAPELPDAVTGLVTDLLEAEIGEVDRDGLRSRIALLGPSGERGFLPVEPGIPDDARPTGTLGADVVSALREAPRSGGTVRGESSPPAREATPHRSRTRSSYSRRGNRNRRTARSTRRRLRISTVGIVAVCCAGAIAGAVLMLDGAMGEASQAQSRQSPSAASTPRPTTTSAAPAPPQADDPLAAVVELSRLRAEAVADADAEALAQLTVPQSPAATADAGLSLNECEDCEVEPQALEISDVRQATASEVAAGAVDAPADAADPSVTAEGWVEGGPVTEGLRAYVGATMRTQGSDPEHVLFVLEHHGGKWRVHSVHAS